ncbi:MAG: ribosome recycling factor [Elusimicrobia bacterium]|nr:ribosome recycling factor [Elusimicrobiota bacterium]
MDPKAKAEAAMKDRVERLKRELSTVRTGRASPHLLDDVQVEYYGSMVPIKQVAAVSVPEARTLEIRPWDAGAYKALESALMAANLGAQPNGDGTVLRLTFPMMTEERRKDLAKQVGKTGEEFRVAVRGERQEANQALKKVAKDQNWPEDKVKGAEGAIQKLTDDFIKQIDAVVADKQKEITTI